MILKLLDKMLRLRVNEVERASSRIRSGRKLVPADVRLSVVLTLAENEPLRPFRFAPAQERLRN